MDKKEEYRKKIEENKKIRKKISIVITILMVLEVINIVYFLIYTFTNLIPNNFYSDHFCIPLSILFMAATAILIPWMNKYGSYKSNTNNDKYIIICGIVLFFAALIMFVGSFAK